jgi:hypothetical protein
VVSLMGLARSHGSSYLAQCRTAVHCAFLYPDHLPSTLAQSV